MKSSNLLKVWSLFNEIAMWKNRLAVLNNGNATYSLYVEAPHPGSSFSLDMSSTSEEVLIARLTVEGVIKKLIAEIEKYGVEYVDESQGQKS